MKIDFENKIFVGVICTSSRRKKDHWKSQLKEIKKLGIKQISLFPTTLNLIERKELYKELELSGVREVKLLHLRDQDFTKKEIDYFYNKFKTRVFNCHEKGFDSLYKKFPEYRKNIVLELNYDNVIGNKLEPNKMGGFCIDLAHFNSAKVKNCAEFDYTLKHFKDTKFIANHLNGFSKNLIKDIHFVSNIKQFNYIKELSAHLFGKIIGLELENSIKTQLKFKKHLVKLLNKKFNKK